MRFARIDLSAAEPRPVIGWYDLEAFHYPDPPPKAELVALTNAEWEGRMDLPFVADGRLVPAPPRPRAALVADAVARLGVELAVRSGLAVSCSIPGRNAPLVLDAGPAGQARLAAAATALMLDPVADVLLVMKDGTPELLSADNTRAVLRRVGAYTAACNGRYAELHALVRADPDAPVGNGWPAPDAP